MSNGSDPEKNDIGCEAAGCSGENGEASEACRIGEVNRKFDPSRWYSPAEWCILLVRIYQLIITPWLPNSCRFSPTCSSYSIEALRIHGLIKGVLLTGWRLLRCQPLCKGGYDPVPPRGCWRHKRERYTGSHK